MDTEVLLNLLANPADVKDADTSALQLLVDEYPQSGIFRVLLAGNGNQQNIAHAAVYSNPATLYKLINSPDDFQPVAEDQIIRMRPSSLVDEVDQLFPVDVVENHIIEQEPTISSTWPEDHHQNEYTTQGEQERESDDAEVEYYKAHEAADVMQDLAEVEIAIDEEIKEEPQPQAEETKEQVAVVENIEPERTYPLADKTEYFHQDIDDEIYDEIISIEDINLEQLAVLDKQSQNPDPIAYHTVNSDHFVFEPEVASESHTSVEDKPQETIEEFEGYSIAKEPNIVVAANEIPGNKSRDISRYNDEKLPYTFMWWLDKTRREHATVYQPYVNNPSFNNTNNNFKTPKRDTMDELQQQYVESIFNVSVIDELERSPNLNNNGHVSERKEDQIIKRFIQSEPHIKHAGGVNLDNENKAKRSSEDADAMVTETLARIYTEQMLYQKAINTYKKLMLKFPEKSLYFASQIEQLENKPN